MASCIHEAFALISPDEDANKLRECLKNLLEIDQRNIIISLVENIETII